MSRHLGHDPAPNQGDVDAMAAVLESRHGAHAADVAEFFSIWYDNRGDFGRSCAWAGVAEKVRRREQQRLGHGDPSWGDAG